MAVVADVKEASFTQAAAVNTTWYTALNASIAGRLFEVTASRASTGDQDYTGYQVSIRVTIDGRSAQTFDGSAMGGMTNLSDWHQMSGGGDRVQSHRIQARNARIANTLLVEVSQASGGAADLHCIAHYAEE